MQNVRAGAAVLALLWATVVVGLIRPAQASDEVGRLPALNPAQTTIAILPVIDATGEKDDQRRDQANAVKREMETQFRERGFALVDDAAIGKAIADAKIDLADEENQRRATLYQIGKAVGADYVIFSVVTETRSKIRKTTFSDGRDGIFDQREGTGKTKTWFLDVRNEKPILTSYVWEGKSAGTTLPFSKGQRSRMGAAAGNSIRDVLNRVLSDYPKNKKQAKR